MSNLQISQNDYHRILTCVGYPVISETDLGVSADNLKDLFILPALQNVYFKWFPIKDNQDYSINSTFNIDFPDINTFGVLDVRFIWRTYGYGVKTGNPLIDERNISPARKAKNMWDTGNDYGYSQVDQMEKAYQRAKLQNEKAVKKSIDYQNRKITGYTNTSGRLSVIWAKYSTDFNDVEHRFKEDVIKLSQSYILQYFGRLYNQGAAGLPTEIDGNDFVDRADELYEEVMTKFKQFTKPIILRG